MTKRTWLAVFAVGLVLPGSANAQWPAGQGNYWVKVSTYYHQATESFRPDGEKLPFFNSDAVSTAKAVFVEGLVGITDKLDFWVQVPYFDLSFNDIADDRASSNLGDIRLSARYNLFQFRNGSVPVSVRFTTKIPVTDVEIDAEVVPVGEGQFDYEVWLESGISLWPLPAYSVVWLGYRFRAANDKTSIDPGDEVTFLAEFGGTSVVGSLGGKVVLDGTFSRRFTSQGIQLGDSTKREIMSIAPTLFYSFSESTLVEAAIRYPLMGQNFVAGNQFSLAIFHSGSLFN